MTVTNWLGLAGLALLVGFGVHVIAVLTWFDRAGMLVGLICVAAALVLHNNPTLFKATTPPKP
jgi:hypothetical protein